MATRIARSTTTRPRARRGRPRTHHEAWTKVSVVMFERQVLDRSPDDRNPGQDRREPDARGGHPLPARCLERESPRRDLDRVRRAAQAHTRTEAVGLIRKKSVYKYFT